MSRKLTQFLAVLLVVSTTSLGWWAGIRYTKMPPAVAISTHPATTKVGSGPIIAFPPPLASPDAEELAQAIPDPRLAPSEPSKIIPGGVVTGQATDRMWETTANISWQVRAASLTPPNWFITGVVKRGDQTQIIVQFDGEPKPHFLKIGDALPGGGRLAWVRPDAIGVRTPGRKKMDVPVLSGAAEHNTNQATTANRAKPSELPRR